MRAHKCSIHARYRRSMGGASHREIKRLDKMIRRENRLKKKETK
jgi:hypothetical protein